MHVYLDGKDRVVAISRKKLAIDGSVLVALSVVATHQLEVPEGHRMLQVGYSNWYHKLIEGRKGDSFKDYEVVADLAKAKIEAHKAADIATTVTIDSGHDYVGQKYSLSANSQMNLLMKMIAINAGIGITYPIVVNTKDDESSISLKTKEDFITFFVSAMDAKDVALDVNIQRKAEISAAKTVDELNRE